jgi:RNA polymerase sigma-70 factor (ECF subfamily)
MKKNNFLIEGLKNSIQSSQKALIKKFNSRIQLFFRLRIKNEEGYDDLVQEVFTSFFNAVEKDKISEDKYIAPFIFGIAKRVMFNYFYKKKKEDNIQKKSIENYQLAYNFEEEERLENESLNNIIKKYLDKLAEIDRIILKEFYLKEKSLGEVAELVGKSKHYISVRKERALKKIKNEILRGKDIYNN